MNILSQALGRFKEKLSRGIGSQAVEYATRTTMCKLVDSKLTSAEKGVQILLLLKYKELLYNNNPLPAFRDVEFRCFSQNGEDGILLYIFSLIGTTSRKSIELCAGDGIECNTANLIINHGWEGLLVDGNASYVCAGKDFYGKCKETFLCPPTFVHSWVTAENVNALIIDNGFEGEIDLLSLDMDGVDYWIWKAIDCVQPKVVALECRPEWGPNRSVTVPYKPDFYVDLKGKTWAAYGGASLPAFVKLAKEKGYRLVGSTRLLFNVFFVRDGLGEGILPEIPAAMVTGDKENLEWVDPKSVWIEV
jgi:hypothetical protein